MDITIEAIIMRKRERERLHIENIVRENEIKYLKIKTLGEAKNELIYIIMIDSDSCHSTICHNHSISNQMVNN